MGQGAGLKLPGRASSGGGLDKLLLYMEDSKVSQPEPAQAQEQPSLGCADESRGGHQAALRDKCGAAPRASGQTHVINPLAPARGHPSTAVAPGWWPCSLSGGSWLQQVPAQRQDCARLPNGEQHARAAPLPTTLPASDLPSTLFARARRA